LNGDVDGELALELLDALSELRSLRGALGIVELRLILVESPIKSHKRSSYHLLILKLGRAPKAQRPLDRECGSSASTSSTQASQGLSLSQQRSLHIG
jgi:hypothetical protein